MDSIQERVIGIIAKQLGHEAAQITPETEIANDLGADSLDLADLMIAFEDEFNINIDESDAQSISTVGDVIKHIQGVTKND